VRASSNRRKGVFQNHLRGSSLESREEAGSGHMNTLGKRINRTCMPVIIGLLALLSVPTILTAWEGVRGAELQHSRLRQQEWLNGEFQKLMAKSRVQQAQMRQWHSDAARSRRSVAKAARVKLQNDRKAGGSAQ
jgi:cell division protein FtsB